MDDDGENLGQVGEYRSKPGGAGKSYSKERWRFGGEAAMDYLR